MPDTRLVIVRHGESRAQVARRYSGHSTCTGLSDRGRRQAEALRERLVQTQELGAVDALYTSVLTRAIETAALLAPAMGEPAPVAECALCEIHAGSAEGLTYEEFDERFPAAGPIGPREDPYARRVPDGETWAEVYARVGARLRRIADEHAGECVVVVGHGGTVGASFVALGETSPRAAVKLIHEAANTSITEWRGSGDDWHLVRFNDAAHLPAPESDPSRPAFEAGRAQPPTWSAIST